MVPGSSSKFPKSFLNFYPVLNNPLHPRPHSRFPLLSVIRSPVPSIRPSTPILLRFNLTPLHQLHSLRISESEGG